MVATQFAFREREISLLTPPRKVAMLASFH
jgi:hypothetical protein